MLTIRHLILISLTLAASACMTTNVEVPTTQFPVPLMQKLPLTMGLFLPDELRVYEFREDLGDAGTFEIEIGGAQETMFNNLLSGMFQEVVAVGNPDDFDTLADGILVPRIAEMQFSTPQQTRTDYFEVWIRYDLSLHSSDGTLVGQWPLTAYGKANTQNYLLATTSPALTQAALNACRDAMAFFTVQFQTIPAVQQWLLSALSNRQGPASKPDSAPAPATSEQTGSAGNEAAT